MAAGGIPLAALRADLDRGWPAGARWTTTGGLLGAVLEQPAGGRLAFALRAGDRGLRLRGRVEIAGGGQGRARVRVRVARRERGGAEKLIWSGDLRRLFGRPLPLARRLDARFAIPGGADLVLSVEGPEGERVLWRGLEISLDDGAADAVPASPPAAAAPPALTRGDRGDGEDRPLFSVLTPVHDPPLEILEQTLASVLAQTFRDWELCLVDDGSKDPLVREALGRAAAGDPRVRLLRREVGGGIAIATNAALEMARGEYVALLDHDDLLVPDALAQVEAVLRERPDTDMLYSDEEVLGEDGPTHTFAKPHWSPDLLRSQMYTCHLGVYRRSLATEVGGFQTEFDGSQDFDFALRLSERSDRVVHIPRVLYHWRAHAGSTAGSAQAKPAAYPAARRAIAQHLERTEVDAEVHFGPWQGIYRVVHRLPAETAVAVGIVGEPGSEPVRSLAEAIVDEESSGVAGARVAVAASVAEAAVECAGADVIVLCEAPVEPLTRLWLARLAAFARQPGVAAVGARTLSPDGRVEQGGVAIEAGLPLPLMFAAGAGDPGPLGVGLLPANVAAVGGVVAVGGEPFERLGGLASAAGELALADYCLRGLAAGLRVVSAPDVILRRRDGRGPVNDLAALAGFRRRWAAVFPRDPYFETGDGWPGVDSTPTDSG